MDNADIKYLAQLLNERNTQYLERERDLAEQQEELLAQKEELTAAIEELVLKNNSLEEALRKLKLRNDELDQVLYRASHDLKSPVASLQGLLDLLRTESLSDSQGTLVFYMEQKILQMNNVLKSLSMLARASFDPFQRVDIPLEPLVEETVNELKFLPGFPTVKISKELNGLVSVASDPSALQIIVHALLANAIIFRDPTVQGKVAISISRQAARIAIEVSDDGEGISPEAGKRMFEMFFRGSIRSHGSGLGLYIVDTVVKRMKGEIRWVSKPGDTTFQVLLPESPDV